MNIFLGLFTLGVVIYTVLFTKRIFGEWKNECKNCERCGAKNE